MLSGQIQKQKFALLLFLLLSSMPLGAKEKDCLIMHMQSGEKMIFMLEDQPQIFFTETGMEIGLHSFAISEVTKYTFGDSENLSEDLSDAILQKGVSLHDGMLFVSLSENSSLRICTVAGQEIHYQPVWQQDNKIMIDINTLPTGIYVLSTGTETLKIMKK